ncbi:MAG: decaprenyl-phosphate phosphoribosyltransferase [Myxococcales bacterium]|nr:decaprenyl-phosphate phosphoribosyltransferase [Myxococcales bacterium]MCB9705673.1 decaprenyl-phosphate phosphoribosyltransferase [Myxococcales bacterium]
MILPLLQTLRPRQWLKNIFVAVPLVFGQKLTDPVSLLITAGAVALFSLVSGCVYILNDLVDVEKDRAHPQKRHRPIPSGRLPPAVARAFAVVAVPVALGLGYWLEPAYALVLGVYFAQNVAYSFKLKNVPYLDVASIALGFILRVLAGAYALQLPPSPWLLGCTGLLALFLGFGKRTHELGAGGDGATKQRASLAKYSPRVLRALLYSVAVATIALYVAYTLSDHVVELFGTHRLVYTAIFAVIGMLRFIQITTTRHDAESPTEEMLRDPLFMLNFVVGVVVSTAILYGWI